MAIGTPPLDVARSLPPVSIGPQLGITLTDPFLFVPVNGADAAKGRGRRTLKIRAHVTRVQHARSALARKTSSNSTPSQAASPDTCGHCKSPIKTSRPAVSLRRETSNKQDGCASSSPSLPSSSPLLDSDSDLTPSPSPSPTVLPSPALVAGRSGEDPFWTFPVERSAFLPKIIHHYLQHMAQDIPEIDGAQGKGLLRSNWFPFAMTEPTLFYPLLLLAAAHYCAFQPHLNHHIDVLDLKMRSLRSLNEAIRDPSRAGGDALVAAVSKLGAYEAIFGEMQSYVVHARALQQMVKLRGGLSNLGLNGLVERVVVWSDFNAAIVVGIERMLGTDEFPTNVVVGTHNPAYFGWNLRQVDPGVFIL